MLFIDYAQRGEGFDEEPIYFDQKGKRRVVLV